MKFFLNLKQGLKKKETKYLYSVRYKTQVIQEVVPPLQRTIYIHFYLPYGLSIDRRV